MNQPSVATIPPLAKTYRLFAIGPGAQLNSIELGFGMAVLLKFSPALGRRRFRCISSSAFALNGRTRPGTLQPYSKS